MTLSARIQLIDDMIRENPDYTVRDYLEMVGEIERIQPEDRPVVEEVRVADVVEPEAPESKTGKFTRPPAVYSNHSPYGIAS